MKVLGIDPGTAACGYGVVAGEGGRLSRVDHGWWQSARGERTEVRLKRIHDSVRDLILVHEPEAVALEET